MGIYNSDVETQHAQGHGLIPSIAKREVRGGMWELFTFILSSENFCNVYQLKLLILYKIKMHVLHKLSYFI